MGEGGKKTGKEIRALDTLKRKYNKWETYTMVKGIILNI